MIKVLHLVLADQARNDLALQMNIFQIARGDEVMVKSVLSEPKKWHDLGISYQPVAQIDVGNKDDAFQLTNHIDRSWTENKGVQVLGDGRFRSTSMGDVMLENDEVYVVSSFGFTSLGSSKDFPGLETNDAKVGGPTRKPRIN